MRDLNASLAARIGRSDRLSEAERQSQSEIGDLYSNL